MSLAFRTYNSRSQADVFKAIKKGLNIKDALAIKDVNVKPGGNWTLPNGVAAWAGQPAPLQTQLDKLNAKWRIEECEANRRVLIDEIITEVMNTAPGAAAATPMPAMPGDLKASAEYSVSATNPKDKPPSKKGQRIGHGRYDYIVSGDNAGIKIFPNVIIEAKLSLNTTANQNAEEGQWQLLTGMATAPQMPSPLPQPSILRGILSDGKLWRFYELDVKAPGIKRTDPAIDATDKGAGRNLVAALIYCFFANYKSTGGLLP